MRFKALFLVLIIICPNYTQIITNSKQTYNQVSLEISFESAKHTVINSSNEKVIVFNDFIDFSSPGTFALPSKELTIALPSYSHVRAELLPVTVNKIKGTPAINPSASFDTVEGLKYFEEKARTSLVRKNPIEILGYLWLKGFYCVRLRVNQYQYNNGIIEELSSGKLNITLLDPLKNNTLKMNSSDDEKEFLSSVINNYKYAVTLNKALYEPTASNNSWIDFSKTYLKTGVNADGIYRITGSDLKLYGIDAASIPSSSFRMIYKGSEIPVLVKDNNGFIDDNGYIEFAGRRNWGGNYRDISTKGNPYNEYLDRYSDTSIYWLTWGAGNGLRTDTMSVYSGIPQDTLFYYSEIVHQEENVWLDYSIDDLARRQLPQWKENQTWVWRQQQVGSADRNFFLSDIYPGKNTKAFYKIQDYASDITVFNNVHKVGLSINNDQNVYDSLYLNKYQQRVVSAQFFSNLLQEGNNTLKTISYPTNSTQNSVEVDWVEIEYPRYLKANNDSLLFTINDIQSKSLKYFQITNISTLNPVLYKISGSAKRIKNYKMSAVQGGNTLLFADSVSPGDKYCLIDESKIKSPYLFYKKQFTNIADNNIRADYILLTHSTFLQKADEYAKFIEQNYNIFVKIIDINEVYDQFNFGFFSPEPIRDFLKAASETWQAPKPQYLFIVGDATYDYYNNKHKYFNSPRVNNFVPSYGEPVSDTWFTIWDSTGSLIPQMYVGRLPVNSIEEFDHFLNKHKTYLAQPYDDWNKYYLFFSGGKGDDVSEIRTLKAINDSIIHNTIMPPPVSGIAHHLYKTYDPRTNFGPYSPEEVSQMIGIGGVFTCYVGHSATQIWDNGITDPSQLHNIKGKFSLMSDFGCSTARFAEPDIKAFAELFVNGLNGEAIGYTGNSSLGYLTPLPGLFYEQLVNNKVLEIGKAHTLAKINLLSRYGSNTVYKVILYSNHLISDPVIRLKIPQKPNLVIAAKDISINRELLDDSMDSVSVTAHYFNYGTNTGNPFSVEIIHSINGTEIQRFTVIKNVPSFEDSVVLTVPLKGAVGNHSFTFNLDNTSQIDEIYKNDNQAGFTFNVASNAARILTNEFTDNLSNGVLNIINPVTKTSSDSLKYEIADNPDFISPAVNYKLLDTANTKIMLSGLQSGKRYWFRSKINTASSEFSSPYSFIYDTLAGYSFFAGDTVSFKRTSSENLNISASGIILSEVEKHLRIISAGFNDGAYAVIEVNGNNYLPEGHLGGIHIAVFNDSTLEYQYSRRFSNWDHANFVSDLSTYLDTIPASKLACFAFSSDAGLGIPDSVRAKIRNFGSVYIDSVNLYDSWAMIGKKFSVPGSVPEKFSKRFNGTAITDTSFIISNKEGSLTTNTYGPVKHWKLFSAVYQAPSGSEISFTPIGIKTDGNSDTLGILNLSGGHAELSVLNNYEKAKFIVHFKRLNSSVPVLSSIKIEYDPLDELGLNNQVISISRDTVLIGENISLNYKIYNESSVKADSVKVRLEKQKQDNSTEIISENLIPSIQSSGYTELSSTYNTSGGSGASSFKITVDPENKIKEFYKDNNFYSVPFYVKSDTTHPLVIVTFNGNDIIDGDYVSARPLIRMELNDQSLLPVNDTSAFIIRLNNERVWFLNNPDLKITFNSTNPKAVAEYTPVLKGGEYELSVIGKNSTGNINDSSGIVKRFVVEDNLKLLNVFNYPNPFKDNTNFTFKLTQLPDELKIKIFTVAGRLVKEINKNRSELKFDFNKILWDGRDEDGDKLSNGVYLYKVIVTSAGKTETVISKAVIMK